MRTRRKRYSAEFKREALKRASEEGMTDVQVCEAAVAEALPDGNISDRERALLNSLRDSLGISAADADALEGELTKLQPGIA